MTLMNKVYTERMLVVRALAVMSGCPYGIGQDDNDDWDDEWRNVVYIDLPQGQVSWHIAPHDLYIFEGFPEYKGEWDETYNGKCVDFMKGVKRVPSKEPEVKALKSIIQAWENGRDADSHMTVRETEKWLWGKVLPAIQRGRRLLKKLDKAYAK